MREPTVALLCCSCSFPFTIQKREGVRNYASKASSPEGRRGSAQGERSRSEPRGPHEAPMNRRSEPRDQGPLCESSASTTTSLPSDQSECGTMRAKRARPKGGGGAVAKRAAGARLARPPLKPVAKRAAGARPPLKNQRSRSEPRGKGPSFQIGRANALNPVT